MSQCPRCGLLRVSPTHICLGDWMALPAPITSATPLVGAPSRSAPSHVENRQPAAYREGYFRALCAQRYQAGMAAHGRQPGEPFVGEPMRELLEELADAVNYVRQERADTMAPMGLLTEIEDHVREAAALALEYMRRSGR